MEKLFELDPYLTHFTACVQSCVQSRKGWDVILDQTAFYPEGGGQPYDLGTLGGTFVLEVHEREGHVVHTCDRPLEPGSQVEGDIDWPRHFDLMQHHSGEHIVSGIAHARYGCENVGFHMGSDVITIDLSVELTQEQVRELEPGHVLIVRRDGDFSVEPFTAPQPIRPCSFERIYFSRGSDRDIYRERKRLGALLVPQILRSIDHDIENTVFSYIPNTAESAFFGLVGGLDEYCQHIRAERILHENGSLTEQRLKEILRFKPRFEKVAIKDVKMRTFITQDNDRDDLVAHVYDITYGTIRAGKDNLVILDDSIVRGTTLRQSIVRILDRLEPRKIVVCSSAPQIRYPDCYGIDMSRLGDFVAFRAAVELLRESGRQTLIDDVYRECLEQLQGERSQAANCVKRIYEPFTDEQISTKIAQIIKAPDIRSQVEVIYQTVPNMHEAIPAHGGDWYFTGDYPTPGGNAVADQAFVNFYEKRNERAY